MLATVVDKENFGILYHFKWSNLAFSQYISHTLICSLIYINIITLRIFRMLHKSVKATYVYFSHKIKLTQLTANKCEK